MNLAMARTEGRIAVARTGPARSAFVLRIGCYALIAFLDILVIVGSFMGADIAYHRTLSLVGEWQTGAVVALLYGAIAVYGGAFAHDGLVSRRLNVGRAVVVLLMAQASVLLVAFGMKQSEDISRLVFFLGSALSLGAIALERYAVTSAIKRRFARRVMTNILIRDELDVPAPDDFEVIDARLMRIEPNINDPMMLHLLGILLSGADRVVVACPAERRRKWAAMLKGSNLNGEVLVPEIDELRPVRTRGFAGVSTITVSSGPLDLRNRMLKRTLDLIVTVPVLILLAPLLAAVALAIRLDSQGPVMFVQTRMGRGNRLFRMFKFRSMRTDLCDSNGNRSASRDDDRVTRVGRFIRATSIDELPQLFNVLLGDMSLVGPRPHALGSMAGDSLFWEVDSRYWHRHASKPGITGLAQIRGFRGATMARADLTNRLQADLEYLIGWSLWRDLAILFGTMKVLVHKNAY